MATLSDTQIAVIGCGTIGSHLAKMLVQSGAGGSKRLLLFDTEVLTEGNIGRHLLGFSDISKAKATALAAELQRFHPQVQVQPINEDGLKHWELLAQCDLVIDATGDWNVQSALNEHFLRRSTAKPSALLHSWIFMNAAGVQSFLNLGDDRACFRCLKPEFDGPWRYPAGNEREPLNLQPATCGDGVYVPFSVDASVMAAGLAVRAALDWVNGSPGARLRTIKIDQTRGIQQKPISPEPAKNCPACETLRNPA